MLTSESQHCVYLFHLSPGCEFESSALLSRVASEILPVFVSGNIHQGHEMFGNESRGRQCAFMSLNSILYEQISPVSAWTS